MQKRFRADLHIHTCLSPCADLDMSPLSVVNRALEKGIDIIAVTDHNSAENVTASVKAAQNSGLTVLPGMEITSSEEAHILALFSNRESVLRMQEIVYTGLLPGENNDKLFGEQVVANEKDEVMSFNKRLLIGSTTLPAQGIVTEIHRLGGLAVASHIDRSAFSIISQLGFIPAGLAFDALEISSATSRESALALYKEYDSFAWISSSDAHTSDDIGKRTTAFYMNGSTIDEMRLALQRTEGRKTEWE